MTENPLMRRIQVALSKAGARVFRNNVGQLKDRHGKTIRYGVCNPGGSDLIGWLPVVVTPSMVGHRVAVFVACEVKTPEGRPPTEDQQRFLSAVRKAGGYAMVARSESEATESIVL